MDFANIGLAEAAMPRRETGATITPCINGVPVALNNGENLTLTVILPNTPEGEREVRKWRMCYGRDAAAGETMTEDQLDRAVSREIEGEADLIARAVREWNLIDAQGEPIPCTIENRRQFFHHYRALCADALVKLSTAASDLGNAPTA